MTRTGKISRSAGGIGAAILGSRILGFARDVLIAKYFGTGLEAQAFFAAFRIPNLMRRLFGEGALSASFIPVFTDEMRRKGMDSAWSLALSVITLLSGVLVVSVGAGMVFAPYVAGLIVPGFRHVPGQFELTAGLLRLMFPYLLFISLAALMMGILNSLKHFSAPAVAPMLLNASLIGYLLLFAEKSDDPAAGLGYAVLIGGAAQLLLQAWVAARKGLSSGKFVLFHPGVKRIALLMLPAAGGLAVYQLNVFVDSICASYENITGTGSLAALWYADRLMQFPLAIFGIATATAVFPALSSAASAKQPEEFVRTLEFGIRRVVFLTLPSAAGLVALRSQIVSALFERNEFGAYSTALTSHALMYYCIGLFAYAGVHILSRGFYALQDTRTPVKTAAFSMLLNAVLNVLLMFPLGAGGIALATSLAAMVNFGLLFRRIAARAAGFDSAGIARSFLRILAMAGFMGLVLSALRGWLAPAEGFALYSRLAAVLAAGAGLFFLMSEILGVEEWKTIKTSVFKR